MKIEFKSDFADSRSRWDAFWKNENKKPLVCIVIPKEGVTPVEKPSYKIIYFMFFIIFAPAVLFGFIIYYLRQKLNKFLGSGMLRHFGCAQHRQP